MLSFIIIMSNLFPSPNENANQLVECLLSMNETLGLVPSTTKVSMVIPAYNLSIPELEVGQSGG